MHLESIPDDINVELLLSYLPDGKYKVAMSGLHKRNTYHDIIDIEERGDGTLRIGIGRKSIYNALPEYMFHPVDRFDNLPKREKKERFAEQLEVQEKEKENAYRFFRILDLLLLKIRLDAREALQDLAGSNQVLIELLADRLTEKQRKNRFIRQAVSFLPSCKYLRGNHSLLTFFLRKIFLDEGMLIEIQEKRTCCVDQSPRYACQLGGTLDSCFVGNVFEQNIRTYNIYYWSDEACDCRFLFFVDEVEEFRLFIQDFFLSVEEAVRFDIHHVEPPLRLDDNIFYNYLNYNTYI